MNLQPKLSLLNASLLLLAGSSFANYANAVPTVTVPDVEKQQTPDSGLMMRENRQPPEQPKNQPEVDIEKPEPARPAMLPQNDLRITVTNFQFSGNTKFGSAELAALLNSYTGRELRFADLEAAAEVITKYYRDAGFFLASAYLPQQSIKQGQVEIAILEGKLDGSHLTPAAIHALTELRLNKSVLQRFLDAHTEGDVISESDMEHLSLLINDLPGINSKIVLSPGSKTNTSALSLKVKEDSLLRGYAAFDNQGLYSTGYYRFSGGVTLNDPTGYGDQLNLRVLTTETGNTVAGWADYNAPINGYGTRVAVNFSELHYSLGRDYAKYLADGLARTVGISLMHPLWLTRQGRLMGTAHYEHRWMQDIMGISDTDNDRELNVMSFSFAGNLYDQLFSLGGLTQAAISVSAGEVSFNKKAAYYFDQYANTVPTANSRGIKTNGGYHKFFWQISRTQNLFDDFSLYANFQGQVGSKNLDTSEQISLGGPNAIRAYPVGEGSADEGWFVNAEARYRLPMIPSVPGYLQFISFIDTGYSRINANPLIGDLHNSRHLTGYGFGLNWLEVAGFNLHTSIAWRDTKKVPSSDPSVKGDDPTMYFQLTKSF